jgi:orotidine-5'-phosphate decarboxylase
VRAVLALPSAVGKEWKEDLLERFSDRLAARILATGSTVCVGLDPDLSRMPPALARAYGERALSVGDADAVAQCFEEFCCGVVDAVADQVPVVKPQAAFFEQYGAPGWNALRAVVEHARSRGLLVIVDAKRGDIASTATAYARALFGGAPGFHGEAEGLGADAVTLSPYLGADSVTPFLEQCDRGKGVFVLARTSNPGAADLQDRESDGRPLFAHVAGMIRRLGEAHVGREGYSDVGAVVGATAPGALRSLRAELPRSFLLVPGYGAQGGDAAALAGLGDERGLGFIVNASRSIIYAWQDTGSDYRLAAAAAVTAMRAEMAGV